MSVDKLKLLCTAVFLLAEAVPLANPNTAYIKEETWLQEVRNLYLLGLN